MDIHHSQPEEDLFHFALVVTISFMPPAPAEDLVLIDKLKAKSGLEDVEFFVFTDKDIYRVIFLKFSELEDDFLEHKEYLSCIPPAFQISIGKDIAILSSKAFKELTPEENRDFRGVSYSKVIAHELGHKYMLLNTHIFRVVQDLLDPFHEDETRPEVAFLCGEFFADNFADLLLSEKPLSPKNIVDVLRKTRTQIMRRKK